MKSFFLIILGIAFGYFIKASGSVNSEVTYNEAGTKTVVVSCDKQKDCIISIGQKCEDVGFKIVETDHDDMKTILTAECGKEKEIKLRFGL